jgi:pyruvate formate lyase activating enzyme
VLTTLKSLRDEGVFTESTNLVIRTLNDDPEDIRAMCRWIHDSLGPDVPLHFSRFHPDFKLKDVPPTPTKTLEEARDIAIEEGLQYVYIGNVPGHEGEFTRCPGCGRVLLERVGFLVTENRLRDGACPDCGLEIPGIFE